MSEWYDAEPGDIALDRGAKQVDIFVKGDNWGSIYVSLTFDQIKKIHDDIHKEPPMAA